jgi:hypothetical protein
MSKAIALYKVLGVKRYKITDEERETFVPYPDVDRPTQRSDCWDFENRKPIGPRPCPFVTCINNTYFSEVDGERVMVSDPGKDPTEVCAETSCSDDLVKLRGKVAIRNGDGRIKASEIGKILGLTRQGADLIEKQAARKCGPFLKDFKPEGMEYFRPDLAEDIEENE